MPMYNFVEPNVAQKNEKYFTSRHSGPEMDKARHKLNLKDCLHSFA